tara:strand:+ start:963 stop:1499 length:537 start_codon:yes stop_codon:yes gene_type:complete
MKRILTKWKTYLNEGGITIQKHTGRGGSFSREVFRDHLAFYIGSLYPQFEDIGEILTKISATPQEKQVMADDLSGILAYYNGSQAIDYFDGSELEAVSIPRLHELLKILADQGVTPVNPPNPKMVKQFYVMGKDLTATRSQSLPSEPAPTGPPTTKRLSKTAAMSYDDILKLQKMRSR